jgi:hypothetical protein
LGCTNAQDDPEPDQVVESRAEQLGSLPYIARPTVREEHRGLSGVVRHATGRTYEGFNLYGSLTRGRILLRDMSGEIVASWNAENIFSDLASFPLGREPLERAGGRPAPGIMVAELHRGALFTIESLSGIAKLDRDSNVLFALNNNAHHDLDVSEDGTIYVLTAVPREIDLGSRSITVIDDQIEILSPGGELRERHSIFEILSESPRTRPLVEKQLRYASYWFDHLDEWFQEKLSEDAQTRAAQESLFDFYRSLSLKKRRELRRAHELYLLLHTPADILHSNALQVLSGGNTGDVLVSVRELDLVAIVNVVSGEVSWSWGPGELSRQHQPSLLPDGNLLIFDNGTKRRSSRIIEVKPATQEIVWSYGETPGTKFFCGAMGGVQGLPNGNVLITDSGAGRVLEVDRASETVWEFFNPDSGFNPFDINPAAETIEAIYRVTRVSPAELEAVQLR